MKNKIVRTICCFWDKVDQKKLGEVVANLSDKYSKPLSVRFVSDGKTRIGERTSFNNQYLKDVVIREL